jgi:asparagine synthase (glutamine-hydrolysing)
VCGIVGIYAFAGRAPHRALWLPLIHHLTHRGPDEAGSWAQGPYFLGHRRLSIVDLASGAQPMVTEQEDLAVTFNGEIYNHPELRSELEAAGHRFRTRSDTEVLLHGYRQWGRALPEHLVGQFAFAIADARKDELFLARDRFGEKPLLLLRTSGFVAFASELRPLVVLPEFSRRVNERALGRFAVLNYAPGTETLARGIERLEPASWRVFGSGGREEGARYWSPPEQEESRDEDTETLLERFRERFDRAVALALRSDVPVGLWLSGGIDSSLVAESAARQGKALPCYALDVKEERYSEKDAAAHVARRLGLPFEAVPLTPPSGEDFLALVEHADDPLADSSALAVWTLARGVRRRHKVVLGGDGGDEMFGGYLTYRASLLHKRWISPLPSVARRLLAALGDRIPTSEGKVTPSYKAWRFLRAAPLPTHEAHFTWNGSFTPERAAALLGTDEAREGALGALLDLGRRHALEGRSTLLDLQRADVREYLPNDILAKVDRMSMAHSLEVRAPFLVPEVASFGLTLPASRKIGPGGELKSLLRLAARRALGPEVADRPKQGFSIPVHAWIRGPLRETFEDLFEPKSLAATGCLDPAAVSRAFADHMSGRRSYGFEIWGLAVFLAWHRARIQSTPPPPVAAPVFERSGSGVSP